MESSEGEQRRKKKVGVERASDVSHSLPLFLFSKKTLPLPSPPAAHSTPPPTMALAMTQAPARVVRSTGAAAKACAARYVAEL